MLHTRTIAVSVLTKGVEVQVIAGKKGADYAVDQWYAQRTGGSQGMNTQVSQVNLKLWDQINFICSFVSWKASFLEAPECKIFQLNVAFQLKDLD